MHLSHLASLVALLASAQALAGPISSLDDPALAGAGVYAFQFAPTAVHLDSLGIPDVGTITDGGEGNMYVMTYLVGPDKHFYSGGSQQVTFSFDLALSAFAIDLNGIDFAMDVTAFDAGGAVLETLHLPSASTDWGLVGIAAAGIRAITLSALGPAGAPYEDNYSIRSMHYVRDAGGASTVPTPVPEPAGLLLTGTALLGLVLQRRRCGASA